MGTAVQLTAEGLVDEDGQSLTYRWEQTGGAQGALGPLWPSHDLVPQVVGTYSFNLYVDDGRFLSVPKSVELEIGLPPGVPLDEPAGDGLLVSQTELLFAPNCDVLEEQRFVDVTSLETEELFFAVTPTADWLHLNIDHATTPKTLSVSVDYASLDPDQRVHVAAFWVEAGDAYETRIVDVVVDTQAGTYGDNRVLLTPSRVL